MVTRALREERGLVRRSFGERGLVRRSFSEGGFSLVEMMVATGLTMAVVGAAVALSTGVQTIYNVELEDAAVQQEARYALEQITRAIAAAGSDPYDVASADSCTADEPGIDIDIDDDSVNEDDAIRILADVNPPNGLLAGEDTCSSLEYGEDVTYALDAGARTITVTDPLRDGGNPVDMTDSVVSDLQFVYLDANRNVTTSAANIRYVQVALTVQSKARNPYTGAYTTYTHRSEVAVRSL
jgi:Tfp pilus assembly protein PilW